MADFTDLGDPLPLGEEDQPPSEDPDAKATTTPVELEPAERVMGGGDQAPTSYSHGGPIADVLAGSTGTRPSRVVQRVWDLGAQRWAYYIDTAPNGSPAPEATKPPHSGNLDADRHEVLYEAPPDLDPYALLTDLDALRGQTVSGFVTHSNLQSAVGSAVSTQLSSALEGQDIGTLASTVSALQNGKADKQALTDAISTVNGNVAALGNNKANAADLASYIKRLNRVVRHDALPPEYTTAGGDELVLAAVGAVITLRATDPIGTIHAVKRYQADTQGGGFVTVIAGSTTYRLYGPRTTYIWQKHTGTWELLAAYEPDLQPSAFRTIVNNGQIVDAGEIAVVSVADLQAGLSRSVNLAQRFPEQGECVVKIDGLTDENEGSTMGTPMVAISGWNTYGNADRTINDGRSHQTYYLGGLGYRRSVRLKLVGRVFHVIG